MRPARWIVAPFSDAAACLLSAAEANLAGPGSALRSAGALVLATVGSWYVYVPVHELLHAFGCVATGGRVEELRIAPLYGGRLLARVFPFVRAHDEYAGRLAGFDTGGSNGVESRQ